ncbi:EAL domain-containing protein [Butyrivibrio sp. AE3004]|uniref:EAL domain-containing protein n=1 Tax=Butyrivibrio sp. AE3004 TaxID=1506994 RepID=UPI00049487B9|nr:EAL domain-containing protein [Butyrivibrio sp. AE3004]
MTDWNFSYIIPSLLILVIIMGYYFSLPRLPIRLNRVFLAIMIAEGFTIIMDILSSWADNEYYSLPAWLLVALNSLYFIGFLECVFLYFEITVIILRIVPQIDQAKRWLIRMPFTISEVFAVLGIFGGYIFYIDETGYHRGPFHFIIYACLYFYIALSFFLIFTNFNRIRRRQERVSVICLNSVLFIGSVFRILLPQILIYDTFCLMAIMIIYLSYVNPEFYLERRNMAFNNKALRTYIEENEGHGRYKILAFIIRDYHDIRELYGTIQMNQGIALISGYLRKNYPEVMEFYYQSGRFVLLGDTDMDWEDIHEELRHRFMLPWRSANAELYLEAGFALIDCEKGYTSADVVLNTITVMLEQANKLDNDFNILVSDDPIADYEDRLYLKRTMENAIDQRSVEVYLQPIIDAKKKKLVGAEALARIRDNGGNIIPPGAFIPIAEQNGRINQLGEQVFEKVCEFIADTEIKKMGMQFINVNLSPIQFMRADLGRRFLSEVHKYGIDPEIIHLEITEEAMIDEQQMEKQIQIMQKEGFKFVLDDYGKGYSNLSRLKKSPFINVKLDMEVVWDYCSAPDHIVPMMVGAFKKMNFSITAEGIETEDMARKMTDIGCDYLQGMLFSSPMSMEDFVKKYGVD